MDEVYRARDTKLDREVALRILPESFAGDHDRLMRFERQARTLASLNHPHITRIHGCEQSVDTSALGMELVDGWDREARHEGKARSLASGTRLGPHEIVAPIGAGLAVAHKRPRP